MAIERIPISPPLRAAATHLAQTPREALRRRLRERSKDPWRVQEIEIPMHDGVVLAADLYAPAGGDPKPAIVVWTPYDKSNPDWVVRDARRYQHHGYAFVAVDCRGRGKSEGEFRAWVNDGKDGHDTVEWVAAQPWCDGAVGTTGASYSGWAQWATAFEHPSSLRCMISSVACGRFMEAMPFIGGCLHLWYPPWCYMLRHRITADTTDVDWDEVLWRLPVGAMADGLGIGGRTWLDLMEHECLDEFWRSLRFDGRYGEIDVPVLHVTGWWDYSDAPATLHHYLQAAQDAPVRQRLIVGPWSHVGSVYPDDRYDGVVHGPHAALDLEAAHLRFFDHHLRGGSDDEAAEPGALFFITGANVWHSAERWPLASTEEPWHLDAAGADGALSSAPPAEPSTVAYIYDPDDPVRPAIDFALDEMEPPLDQTERESRDDVVTFTSLPLTAPLLICGIPRLELLATTDGDDTDWHVKLTQVDGDERSLQFASGRLRASYANDLGAPAPVKPGEARRYEIALDACTHELQAGHRLRLSVTSSDFPWFARNPNRFSSLSEPVDPRLATNTVLCGPGASRLLLPVSAVSEPA
jgi:putative CocE/NonD family hydrolase